jgi:hypothetical protein
MLIKADVLAAIAAGQIDTAFRRWRRPTVKSGGALMTAVGILEIESVTPLDAAAVTEDDLRRAGLAALPPDDGEGQLYRIRLRHVGPDPRIALRAQTNLAAEDRAALNAQLARLPWAIPILSLIAANPGRAAADLATKIGVEKPAFKDRVRKLKALGLTESLEVGYRLSPRGAAVLAKN